MLLIYHFAEYGSIGYGVPTLEIQKYILYARHYKPLLNTNHTQGQNFLKKNLLENKKMDFKNGVKNIQTAGFIGECTVLTEGTLYNIERGRTMAHYCTHLCQQRTILYSITADSRQGSLAKGECMVYIYFFMNMISFNFNF